MPTRLVPAALLLLALLSGCAALVYETVWLRWFRLLFGNTAYAASATLCAFFAGLALGAALFGRLAGRSRHPLRLYAMIEAGAAVTALAVPWLVSVYDPIYAALYDRLADSRGLFLALKFALAFAACLPTATLLGGTFPVLGTAFVSDARRMGSSAALLYAVNTAGAALGSAAGALWLPEIVGVSGTYSVAIALSFVAASAAWLGAPPAASAPPAPEAVASSRAPFPLRAVAFASGLGTLAFEVLLVHALALMLSSSIYSFGAVLIVVLVSLAAAAAVASVAARRLPVATLLVAALVAEAVALLVFPWIVVRATGGLVFFSAGTFGRGVVLASLFGGPLLLLAGLVLPFTFRLAEGGVVGPRLGGLLAANTLGAIAGSVVASFVLLDGLGLWPSFVALACVYAAVAVAFAGSLRRRALCVASVALPAAAVLATGASPFRLPVVPLGANERLVAVAEGAHGIVAVVDTVTDRFEVDRRLKVDSEYTLSGSLAQLHQRRMGHLALLLHGNPRRVAYVGSATGETASAALAHPVEEIVLVEIVPEVQELAARYFAEANGGVYTDSRTRVVVEDGRNHLRAARETYDAITADLFVPWRPGVAAMYSLESFAATARRLAPGGVFCQWLPLYQLTEDEFEIVARTFLEIFPAATLWRADFFVRQPTAALCGRRGRWPSASAVEAAALRLRPRVPEERWITDPRALWMLYVGPASALPGVEGAPVHSDAFPVFEYEAARGTEPERLRFSRAVWPDLWRHVLEASVPMDPAFPERSFESAWAGGAFLRASALVLERGEAGLSPARAILRERVPAEWLRPADFTFTEAWPFADPQEDGR